MEKKERNVLFFSIALVIVTIILTAFKGRRRIIKFAGDFLGEEELLGNMGFYNKTFEELMKDVGWKRGDAWCVYFNKVVWYNMLANPYRDKAMKLLNGNSQETLKNFRNDDSGLFKVTSYPKIGDIAVWQSFKYGIGEWKGHTGIVIKVRADYFESIEGNTNLAGGAYGYMVAKKQREYDFRNNNGLRLKAFISIK